MSSPTSAGASGPAAPAPVGAANSPGARRSPSLWFALTLVGATLAFTIRIHAWLVRSPTVIGWDEGYIGAFAMRLLGGTGLPYVDAVSHRGPVLYWVAAAAQAIGGQARWDGIRWLTALLSVAAVALCFAAGQAARRPLAGAVGGLVYAYLTLCGLELGEGAALNGEPLAAPLSIAAFALATWALGPPEARAPRARERALLAAGVLAGLAAMTKQTSAVAALPLIAWAALAGAGASARRDRWGGPLAVCLGFASVPLSIVGLYLARGQGAAFLYWFWTYNARVYMDPYHDASRVDAVGDFLLREPVAMLALSVLLAGSAARIAARTRPSPALLAAARRSSFEIALLLEALLSLAAAAAPLRFYPHYFVTALPWLGLLAGVGVERAVGPGRRSGGRAARSVVVVLFSGLLMLSSSARLRAFDREAARGEMGRGPDALCRAIAERSAPSDSIFVWGFDGDVYVTCQRRPASRFVATTMLAGIVPPFGGRPRDAYVAEGSRALVLADLEQSRPAVIVDMQQRLGVSIRDVPELEGLLGRDYCGVGQVVGRHHRAATLYVRRDQGGCSPPAPTPLVPGGG